MIGRSLSLDERLSIRQTIADHGYMSTIDNLIIGGWSREEANEIARIEYIIQTVKFGSMVVVRKGKRHDGTCPYALIVNQDGETMDDYRYTAVFLDDPVKPTMFRRVKLYASEIKGAISVLGMEEVQRIIQRVESHDSSPAPISH